MKQEQGTHIEVRERTPAEAATDLSLPEAPVGRFPTLIQQTGPQEYKTPELYFARPPDFVGNWTPHKKLEMGKFWPTAVPGGTWLYNGNNLVLHGFGQESSGWT